MRVVGRCAIYERVSHLILYWHKFPNDLNDFELYPPAQDVINSLGGKGVVMTPVQFNPHDQNKKKRKAQHIVHDIENKVIYYIDLV